MRFLSVDNLQPGMKIARSIIGRKKAFMLAKGNVLTQEYIDHLRNGGYSGAYITDEFTEDVEVKTVISDELLQDGIEAIAEGNIGEIINVSSRMVSEITNRENVFPDMFDLRSFDDYTYHHSVSVAIYAVAIGKELGLNQEELDLLGLASLCHDLGKLKIPKEVLNKPGRLTDEEFALIKGHPKAGYDMLYSNPNIPAVVRQAVVCHHENEDGSGYPNGLMGDKIPKFAKIIHVADVYDALTSRRAYKEPNTPVDTLEYLMGGCETLFDREVVEVTLDVLPSYPPGIEVGLSNGESGIVIAHTSNSLRPKVKLYGSGKIVDLDKDPGYLGVNIVSSGYLTQESSKVEVLNEDRGKSRASKRIVFVGDRLMEQKQMQTILEGDYIFEPYKNGYDAIARVKEGRPPELLIVDLDVGGLDGISIAKSLRTAGYQRESLPIMFIGSARDRATILKLRELAAADYILKPINAIYIKKRVDKAIHKDQDVE